MAEKNEVRICVPVCVSHGRELSEAVARAAEVGDMVELRFDCLKDEQLNASLRYLPSIMKELDQTAIFTFRPSQQGGNRDLSFTEREQYWTGMFWSSDWCWVTSDDQSYEPFFADLELDRVLDEAFVEGLVGLRVQWNRIICSHHDFVGVPGDLQQIYERMLSTPARILKIAVQADDVTDCLPVFRLLERACSEGREMIAIAMGPAGIATRILGPSRGAFLTYGALDRQHSTAPGQITAKELRELYHIDRINPHTQIMGLVGLPVAHSVSPHIHNAAFAAASVNAVYIPFEVRDVKAFLRRMIHPRTREIDWHLRGLSLTAPHKAAVIDCLDWIEPAAKEIGAVNTIVVEDDALHGYNTDATAVLGPVIQALGPLRDARCAVIGAGGAASAALWSLRREGARVTVFARNNEQAGALAENFGTRCENLEAARFGAFDLVINTTPLGTSGSLENETPAMSNQLRGARFAYDLVYNPTETRFMREARDAGCEALGGLPMLVDQAAEQFKLWTGADAPVEVMLAAAKCALDR
jgi:3-dehydroquinate dehydratase/shikimate dehydrogenase